MYMRDQGIDHSKFNVGRDKKCNNQFQYTKILTGAEANTEKLCPEVV